MRAPTTAGPDHDRPHALAPSRPSDFARARLSPSGRIGPAAALVLQRTAGNAVVGRLIASGAHRALARTPVSTAVEPLISHGPADWEVTAADEASVLRHLRGDPSLSATIADLDSAGMLGALIDRVDEPRHRRALLRLLGAGLTAAASRRVAPHVAALEPGWQVVFNLARLGVTTSAPAFSPTAFQAGLIGGPTDPFSGVGATGANPASLGIPYVDQAALATDRVSGTRGPTTVAYSNPVGNLVAYLAGLTPAEREGQAEVFANRRISSTMAAAWGPSRPSRRQVIAAAAAAHNLEPALVAGFLLAEQRDQSRNEDAKDLLAATSLWGANTSIGLGQVVISTARRHDLFDDLLASGTRSALGHDEIAEMLASDEMNIFAAAGYIRLTADDGATKTAAALPNTVSEWPAIDFPAYARHSSAWPADNVRALGSEYTSTPWDDGLVPAWGEFVYQAYLDCKAVGI